MLMAPTNQEEYMKTFPKQHAPLRVYASNRDVDDEVLGKYQPREQQEEGLDIPGDAFSIEMIERLKIETKTKNRTMEGNSLLETVLQFSKQGSRKAMARYSEENDESMMVKRWT